MKFTIKNVGTIESATIELGDFTIVCGANNTGKTYITYLVYGFITLAKELLDSQRELGFSIPKDTINTIVNDGIIKIDLKAYETQIPKILEKLGKQYTNYIPRILSAGKEFFHKSQFIIDPSVIKPNYTDGFKIAKGAKKRELIEFFKEDGQAIMEVAVLSGDKTLLPSENIIDDQINKVLIEIFFGKLFDNSIIITSERTGIALFHRELDTHRNVLIEQLINRKDNEIINPFEILDEQFARYALPIKRNIDFTRDIPELTKRSSELFKDNKDVSRYISKNILQGEIKYVNKQLVFEIKRNGETVRMPIYLSSSAVKSVLELDIYIKHLAKKGDLLIIDEPELNLHPDNQRQIVRLLARLVNCGIKIYVTTHSDYFLKELNNLVMLSNDFENKKELMNEIGYDESEIISKEQIKAYAIKNTKKNISELQNVPIDKYGLQMDIFEELISSLNAVSDRIWFNISDASND